jgi:hypothetical protein
MKEKYMARIVDADALIEAIKEQARCSECENYNGVRCRACEWDDAIGIIDDFADNHPYET